MVSLAGAIAIEIREFGERSIDADVGDYGVFLGRRLNLGLGFSALKK